jgi:uroporphyrinogen decarboxylase
MEQLMMDLYLNPGIVEAIVNKVEEFTIGCLEVALKKYPGLIDLIGSGDDYGTQNGLLISPDSIQQFFIPSLKRHYDLGKKHGTMGYHHSCGAIFDIIPLMIDAGLEILNPLQTSAIGMDPMKLKKEFGKDLCFHGGIDTQQTLVTGTPEDVKAEVRERIDVLGPEGYILSPSHTLQADVPAQNIVAMYEEAKEYGSQI